MALVKEVLKRKFIYKGQELPDVPGVHENEIPKIYSTSKPELLNAKMEYKGIEDGVKTFEISVNGGTKG